MQSRPLLVLAALAAATEPDFGREAIARVKERIRDAYGADPMGSTVTTVLVASLLFYRAERGHNPKVNSVYDALVYVSNSLSAGYCDIAATTTEGKAVGSALATFGSSLTGGLMARPVENGAKRDPDAPARAIVERLDRILAALEAGQHRTVIVPPAAS